LKKEVKILYELIRTHVRIALIKELAIAPFNLSGRSDGQQVKLDRRLSGILRGQSIPAVRPAGPAIARLYPRRIFLRANIGLKGALQKPAFKLDSDTVILVEPAFPTQKRKNRLIPVSERNSRTELLRRGWSMRGGCSERNTGNYRLVLSGRKMIGGTEYINLTVCPLFTIEDALASAHRELACLKASQSKPKRVRKPEQDTDFLDYSEEYGDGFSASLMNGPDTDLLKISGLHYTDELNDAVWGRYTWKNLVEDCSSADLIEIDSRDELPCMSDTFYWVAVANAKHFREELRSAMLSALREARYPKKSKRRPRAT